MEKRNHRQSVKISPVCKEEYRERLLKNCIARMKDNRERQIYRTREMISSVVRQELEMQADAHQQMSGCDIEGFSDFINDDEHLELLLEIEAAMKEYDIYTDECSDYCMNENPDVYHLGGLQSTKEYGYDHDYECDIDSHESPTNEENSIICPVCRKSLMFVNNRNTSIDCTACTTQVPLQQPWATNDHTLQEEPMNPLERLRIALANTFDKHFSSWMTLSETGTRHTPCTLHFQQLQPGTHLQAQCIQCGFDDTLVF